MPDIFMTSILDMDRNLRRTHPHLDTQVHEYIDLLGFCICLKDHVLLCIFI